jgi:hypothetical protein
MATQPTLVLPDPIAPQAPPEETHSNEPPEFAPRYHARIAQRPRLRKCRFR